MIIRDFKLLGCDHSNLMITAIIKTGIHSSDEAIIEKRGGGAWKYAKTGFKLSYNDNKKCFDSMPAHLEPEYS